MKENKEYEFYNNVKNWDFSMINYEEECLTNWNMNNLLNSIINDKSVVLDLGTGGGEKVIANFPIAKEIIATDISYEMIKTAKFNLEKSGRQDIKFEVMDNLKMNQPANYFDVVVARNTCIDAYQIFKILKPNGKLLVRGIDKLDCWSLKMMFRKGQCFNDIKSISQLDYENIINAGFKNVELIPIYVREYYKTKEDFLKLIFKTPILIDFSEENLNNQDFDTQIDMTILYKYIKENTFEKGIVLYRRYYGILAQK